MSGTETTTRISEAPPGRVGAISRYSWFSLILLWLIYALNANSRQMLFYVLPSIIKEFKIGPAEVGFLSGGVTAATALLAIPAMVWAERGGSGWRRKYRHLPIAIGYGLLTFCTGLNVITATLGGLIILQLASHAVGGAAEAIEVTSAAEWWPRSRRGFALGMHHTGFPWGTLLGGLVVAAILGAYGSANWRLPFLLYPIPLIVIFAVYWRFANEKRHNAVVDRFDVSDRVTPATTEEAEKDAAEKGLLRQCLANLNISLMAVLGLFATVGYIGLSVWLPQYLAFVAKYSAAQTAAYSVLFTITGGIGMIAWGWISDRLGRKLSLVIVFLWLAVAFCMFKYVSMGVGWLIVVQLVTGLAINAPYTLVYAIAMDSSKRNATGVATSIVDVGLALGGGAGPLLVGYMISVGGGYKNIGGYDAALYVIAGLMLLAALLAALFTRETTGWFKQRDRSVIRTPQTRSAEPAPSAG